MMPDLADDLARLDSAINAIRRDMRGRPAVSRVVLQRRLDKLLREHDRLASAPSRDPNPQPSWTDE
jgi:hypothetical protein